MAAQRAVCIVRNESLTKEVFVVEPHTPVDEFRKMVADKFQHEVEELDMFLQNSLCPLQSMDCTLPTMSEAGINFDPDARNNIMLLPKKIKKTIHDIRKMHEERMLNKFSKEQEENERERETILARVTHLRSDFKGLVNQSNTCYLNSLLQILFMTPEFRNAVYSWDIMKHIDEKADKCVAIQLQKLFFNLQISRRRSLSTIEFTDSFGWSKENSRDQQDIQELFTFLFDALRKSLKEYELEDIINKLYEGKLIDFIKCMECMKETSKESEYIDIQLPLKHPSTGEYHTTVEEAIKGYVTPEAMIGNNQYFCETCNKKCDGEKGIKFVTFPKILNLLLMRFDFDVNTMRSIKLNCRIDFPNVLDLSEQLPGSDDGKQLLYELYAISLHSGTAGGGHYFAYIKNLSTMEWLEFNDIRVKEINEDIFKKAYGTKNDAFTSAYMLTYRRVDPDNQKAITNNTFSENMQLLMMKYSESEEQKFIKISLFYRPSEDSELIKKVMRFGEYVTFDELGGSAKEIFELEVPTKHCKMFPYDPVNDVVAVSKRDGDTYISAVWKNDNQENCAILQIIEPEESEEEDNQEENDLEDKENASALDALDSITNNEMVVENGEKIEETNMNESKSCEENEETIEVNEEKVYKLEESIESNENKIEVNENIVEEQKIEKVLREEMKTTVISEEIKENAEKGVNGNCGSDQGDKADGEHSEGGNVKDMNLNT